MSTQTNELLSPRAGTKVAGPLRLGELLIARGVITSEQLQSALASQAERPVPTRLGAVLVELGYATSEQVVQTLASHLGCPYVRVDAGMVHAEALRTLPLVFLDQHNLLPLRVAEGWLTIALEQFNNPFILSEIERRSGLQVQPVAADSESIRIARQAVVSRTPVDSEVRTPEADKSLEALLGHTGADDLQVIKDKHDDEAALEASAAESPIVKLVNLIIKHALDVAASDIHIEPDDAHVQVRYRVDGELTVGERPDRRLLPAVVSRIKILAGMDISQRRLPQDGSITLKMHDRSIDLRVSTMATRQGEKVVMRIVDRQAGIRSLEDLGLDGDILSCFRQAIQQPHGLVLVTGPTGSGKSTTLYSALSELSSDQFNTSTIEDPVERRLRGVNQFQVHEESGFTFSRALRSLLRQDPDVLMVGEIRDLDTARLATEAALTGHLVLSTLHTNDAVSAVPRLLSMGAERFMVAATLRAVLAQRLVRRLCQSCRKAIAATASQTHILQSVCGKDCQVSTVYIGKGCPKCNNRGSIGRIGVFDLLVLNETQLSAAFASGAAVRFEDIRSPKVASGLIIDGLAKARKGLVGIESLLELACRTTELDPSMAPLKQAVVGANREATNDAV